jgi:hypothetical protein
MPGNSGKDYMIWGRKQGQHAREAKRMRNTQPVPAGFEIEGQGRAARANQPQTTGDEFQIVATREQEEKGDNLTRDTQRGHQEGR